MSEHSEHQEEIEKGPDMRVLFGSVNGEFNVDRSTHIVVHCSDNKHVEVPKEWAAKCPFIAAPAGDDNIHTFEYPATVLDNAVRWAEHYGVAGVAASTMVRPCLYRDFSYVLTDAWDNEYYRTRLCGALNQKHYLTTMNAAEKLGMDGLLDFMAIGLGCKLRNEEDNAIVHDIMGVDKAVEVTEDDLAQVSKDYAWFDEAIKPVDAK